MKILGDYHTHTIYSHGKGTILDNAKSAKEKGLKEIAITDHGYGHMFFAIKRTKINEMIENIKIAEKETGIKVYYGVEANFTSVKGDIDVTENELKQLDILLVGHHRFVKSKFVDKFKLFLPNLLFKSKVSKKVRERNTNTILQAMDKYPIDILTHLNFQMPTDIKRIAQKARETNTHIELNEQKMCFSTEEIKTLIEEKVNFVINSDAHCPQKVGVVNNSYEVIKKYNIPLEQVANLDKLPNFKNIKR